mmetsp:Transcript_15823/g.30961  ORF Transcript_15823/g.30961 Transcript_15823/m.30961 type:complete len:238 (+) Transcript_15823:208-921(+)
METELVASNSGNGHWVGILVSDVRDVVRLALSYASEALYPQFCPVLECRNILGTRMSQTCLHTTQKLQHDSFYSAFELHQPFNSFWDHFFGLLRSKFLGHMLFTLLPVVSPPRARASFHCSARSHTPNSFVFAAVFDHNCARRFHSPCHHTAEHDSVGTRRNALDNVPRSADTAISDDRDVVTCLFAILLHSFPHFKQSSHLRDAVSGHLACRADGPRANAHLERVRPELAVQEVHG